MFLHHSRHLQFIFYSLFILFFLMNKAQNLEKCYRLRSMVQAAITALFLFLVTQIELVTNHDHILLLHPTLCFLFVYLIYFGLLAASHNLEFSPESNCFSPVLRDGLTRIYRFINLELRMNATNSDNNFDSAPSRRCFQLCVPRSPVLSLLLLLTSLCVPLLAQEQTVNGSLPGTYFNYSHSNKCPLVPIGTMS